MEVRQHNTLTKIINKIAREYETKMQKMTGRKEK